MTPSRQNLAGVLMQHAREGTLPFCSCCRERDSRFAHHSFYYHSVLPHGHHHGSEWFIVYVASLSLPWLWFHVTAPTARDASDTLLHTRTTFATAVGTIQLSVYSSCV